MVDDIKRYEFKKGLPLELEVISIDSIFKKSRSLLTSPHRTNFYTIIWFKEGSPVHLVDFKPVQIYPNSLLFICKDKVHFFDKESEFNGKMIFFTDNFFNHSESDVKFLQNIRVFNDLFEIATVRLDDTCTMLLGIFDHMEKELQNPFDRFQSSILRNLMHNFLLLAERRQVDQGVAELSKSADLDYTILFKNMLDKEFKSLKSVGKYACRIHVSEKRLSQATSKVAGRSPKQLIDDRVLLESKRLLVHSGFNVKEIGYELGFEEPTNFIKYFRKHTGCTPSKFRENFASKQH